MYTQDHKSSQMMKVKLPKELILKFVTMEGFDVGSYDMDISGVVFKLKDPTLVLNLAHNQKCFSACVEWYKIIQTYFKTSQKAYRLDIGPYTGLYPVSIDNNGHVMFEFEDVDPNKKGWKDWFIKEDYVYAPQQSA